MIKIENHKEDGHIYVWTTGVFTIEDVKKFLTDAVEMCQDTGCKKILLDHRGSPFSADIFEIYSVATNLTSFGFDISFHGAVIYNQDHEKYRFADDVSMNWSYGILRFFDTIEQGRNWLDKW